MYFSGCLSFIQCQFIVDLVSVDFVLVALVFPVLPVPFVDLYVCWTFGLRNPSCLGFLCFVFWTAHTTSPLSFTAFTLTVSASGSKTTVACVQPLSYT